MSPRQLDTPIREKLTRILSTKSARGGEFAIPFSAENFPLDLRKQYPAYGTYSLEIGCGWGEFTRAWAAKNPSNFAVAIEKKLSRVLASGKEQKKLKLENIRYLILDIAWFFSGIFAENQFNEIIINFPDPWPKIRHHKHRFISEEFAAELARISGHKAHFTFATDNYVYAREAADVFESSPVWKNSVQPYAARSKIEGRPQSYFEQIHREEGALIYFLCYDRR